MPRSHIAFFTNVKKTQIKESDSHFDIEGVPVTVDNAVMNGLLYSAEHNEKGMKTIIDKPVTLSHPVSDDGKPLDAYQWRIPTKILFRWLYQCALSRRWSA